MAKRLTSDCVFEVDYGWIAIVNDRAYGVYDTEAKAQRQLKAGKTRKQKKEQELARKGWERING